MTTRSKLQHQLGDLWSAEIALRRAAPHLRQRSASYVPTTGRLLWRDVDDWRAHEIIADRYVKTIAESNAIRRELGVRALKARTA